MDKIFKIVLKISSWSHFSFNCVRQNTLGSALDMVSRVITTRGSVGKTVDVSQCAAHAAPPVEMFFAAFRPQIYV